MICVKVGDHLKRKHKRDTKTCNLCEQPFETAREMKMHRNTHSYSNISFEEQKCVECDYTCETIESMEVHIGKCCYNYFECGLCEVRVENLEQLEIHLTTCEVYECGICFKRIKVLSDIKKHVKEECEGNYLHHLKLDRDDEKKVKFTQYHIDKV